MCILFLAARFIRSFERRDWPREFDGGGAAAPDFKSVGNIRVSTAEREAAAEQLRMHAADGRITLDELDQRLEACLGATTYEDLNRPLGDLPPARSPLMSRHVGVGLH